jgi:hypothetical protein
MCFDQVHHLWYSFLYPALFLTILIDFIILFSYMHIKYFDHIESFSLENTVVSNAYTQMFRFSDSFQSEGTLEDSCSD